MTQHRKILGIVGSYRKHGTIDTAVTEILTAAESYGAETQKIYLQDHNIEFCTNCRVCLQESGTDRGDCILEDDMTKILDLIENSEGLVLGAPVNFGNINALTQRFAERCICYGYWPWEAKAPQLRNPKPNKKAVLVSSSAAPGFLARFLTNVIKTLKDIAKMLRAKPIGVLWVGMINPKDSTLSHKVMKQAQRLGQKLAS